MQSRPWNIDKDYDTLVTTRKKQLEKPLNQIEEITAGGEVVELVE